MTNNRDAMHAAGGLLLSGALASELAANKPAPDSSKKVVVDVKPRRARVVLSMKDDFALVKWMHDRTPTYGEIPSQVFAEAQKQFPAMTDLNLDHVRGRLAEFAETLPKAQPPVLPLTVEQRLERAEDRITKLGGLCMAQARLINSFMRHGSFDADVSVVENFAEKLKACNP